MRPSLGPVLCVNIMTTDLAIASRCYQKWFEYRETTRGRFNATLARAWGINDLENRDWKYITPGGRPELGGIRLIEGDQLKAKTKPLTQLGWAAAELSVMDVDAIAVRLASSPFEIIGPPRSLGSNPSIKAMQVIGPHGEVLYLTDVRAYKGKLDLCKAEWRFDRTFIVVIASNDLEHSLRHYESLFQVKRVSDQKVRIPILSKAFDLPSETTHRISSLQLAGSALIEIDQYPESAIQKPQNRDALPSGLLMISFLAGDQSLRPRNLCHLNYFLSGNGELIHGPNGEMLEIVF